VQRLIGRADTARASGNSMPRPGLPARVGHRSANDRARHGLNGLEADARHAPPWRRLARTSSVRTMTVPKPGCARYWAKIPDIQSAGAGGGHHTARGPTTVAPRLQTRDNRRSPCNSGMRPPRWCSRCCARNGITSSWTGHQERRQDHDFRAGVPVEEAIDLVLDQNSLAARSSRPTW